MTALNLLLLPGSQRRGSLNLRLAQACATLAREAGAAPTLLDLRALALPLYDGDLEADSGVPAAALTLHAALAAADAVLVVSPEYNGFPPPLLVNAMDWLSRLRQPNGLAVLAGKPVALLAASPGPLGGLRSLLALRGYLAGSFGMLVAPQQFALGKADTAFDATGALADERALAQVRGVLGGLMRLAQALKAGAQSAP